MTQASSSPAAADTEKQEMVAPRALVSEPFQPDMDTAHPHDGEDSLPAASDQPAGEGGWRGLGSKLGSFADLHALDATVGARTGTGLLNGCKGIPVDQVEVERIEVNDTSRVTQTRVAAGTLLAPGVGTLGGALAKKTGNCALVLAHGTTTTELPLTAKDHVAAPTNPPDPCTTAAPPVWWGADAPGPG